MDNVSYTDYISGEIIPNPTREELQAVQVFSRMLVEDFDYPKSHIQTKPQFRVKVKPSDVNKSYPVDIAVFNDPKKGDNDLTIIVECKNPDRQEGIEQLQDYLRFSRAELGVWFNGEDARYFRKIEKSDGRIEFDELPNIPKFGQRVEDIGKFKRKDLRAPHNLKSVFSLIRNHLVGNTVGTTRDEMLAQQLINLIFCKIFDEKFTEPNAMVKFRYGFDEDVENVRDRVLSLFDEVKNKYQDILDKTDEITLDANSVAFVVKELQSYCLMKADRDAIADAFEVFISGALKGGQGQFFTPRNIVKLIIKILSPNINEKIIDPACGSGGFLIEALRHVWREIDDEGKRLEWTPEHIESEKQKVASRNFFGIDKDSFLAKVTKAYMTLVGDGTAGILCDDSLEVENNWNDVTRQKIKLGTFDVVVTNPPFGSSIRVEGKEKLQQFELAYKWKKNKTNNNWEKTTINENATPQILFIERCLQLLKDKGRMAIVLPETHYHAPNTGYILDYIRKGKNSILAVIDLPHNTFKPHCNAKTIVIILQKNQRQKNVVMAVAEEMGHDHQGRVLLRSNDLDTKYLKGSVWDDLEVISEEFSTPNRKSNKFTISVPERMIRPDILVPRYYKGKRELTFFSIHKRMAPVTLGDLQNQGIIKAWDGHGSPSSKDKGQGDFPYIRVADIVNWELYRNPTTGVSKEIWEKFTKNKKLPESEDIVFVRRGSYRIGTVAMVSPRDKRVVLTRELLTIRVVKDSNYYNITPFYLLALLSSEFVYKQCAYLTFIDTTLPNIGDRWQELILDIHEDNRERVRIHNMVKNAITKKWEAQDQIDELRKKLPIHT